MNSHYLFKVESSSTSWCLWSVLIEIGPVVLEEKKFKCRQCIFAILFLPSLGKGCVLSFEQTWIPFTLECFVPWFGWKWFITWFLRRRFLNFVSIFSKFRYYLLEKKCMALRLNKLKFPLPKDALYRVWLKLVRLFLRRRFLKFRQCILAILLSPLGKGRTLRLNEIESFLSKDALWQVWLKLAQWFWRRRWTCEKFTDRRT